jgi:hypothetical protein
MQQRLYLQSGHVYFAVTSLETRARGARAAEALQMEMGSILIPNYNTWKCYLPFRSHKLAIWSNPNRSGRSWVGNDQDDERTSFSSCFASRGEYRVAWLNGACCSQNWRNRCRILFLMFTKIELYIPFFSLFFCCSWLENAQQSGIV